MKKIVSTLLLTATIILLVGCGASNKKNELGDYVKMPHIYQGYWYIGGENTGVKAVGSDGAEGKSAYDLALENGFEGSVEEWLESLRGESFTEADNAKDDNSTYVALEIPSDGYLVDLRSLDKNSEVACGISFIDWGDGTEVIVGDNEDELKHTYEKAGVYEVRLKDLTTVNKLGFRAKQYVIAIDFGSNVTYVGESAFNECTKLTTVVCRGAFPPEIESNSFDVVTTEKTTKIKEVIVPESSLLSYTQSWSKLSYAIKSNDVVSNLFTDTKVTVGESGDYKTINEALEYITMFYPIYKSKGIECVIEIQQGTIINEQIFIEKIDLSYITITTNDENNAVKVDVTDWTGVTHDTRGNRPFFSAENGGRLPAIKCLFSCITPSEGWNSDNYAVGYFCNRGSSGVILGSAGANVGFEGFYDNIIANNNSEIVLREAIARNATRYGVLSRHISRVSARSADITGCGDIAAYADRASMMDVRCADLSGSSRAIVAYHASTVTANETIANNISGFWAVDSRQGSIVNCEGIIMNWVNSVFNINEGGTIVSSGAILENVANSKYSNTPNEVSADGIIYN